MAQPATLGTDQEDNWFGLIERMKKREVVPVLGPDLLEVSVTNDDGSLRTEPFYRLVAEALCAQYGVTDSDRSVHSGWDLHGAVACVLAEKKENGDKVRRSAARIINTLSEGAKVASDLGVLAGIDAFDLFVSLTCDDLLASLMPGVHVASFSPRAATGESVDILPPRTGRRSIFRLLGSSANMTGFAIHEEDVLEYLFALQSEASRRLPIVLPELRRRDLLFIGCGLPDWIGRSLLRMLSDDRLFTKSKQEFFSDSSNDPALTAFVSRFSPNTMIFEGSPKDFVTELARRWHAVRPGLETVSSPMHFARGPTAFLSYASEDRTAVVQLAEALRQIGFADIWLDQKKLVAGDDWSLRIDEAINSCDFFCPVVSQAADARREGVYWEEWRKALERSQRIPDEFIIPVCIDSEPPTKSRYQRIASSRLVELFDRQLAHAPGGALSAKGRDDFRQRVARFNP